MAVGVGTEGLGGRVVVGVGDDASSVAVAGAMVAVGEPVASVADGVIATAVVAVAVAEGSDSPEQATATATRSTGRTKRSMAPSCQLWAQRRSLVEPQARATVDL